ncbi:MAG: hypothetical protein WCK39_02020 [Methanomassiliicoccales archaeon]
MSSGKGDAGKRSNPEFSSKHVKMALHVEPYLVDSPTSDAIEDRLGFYIQEDVIDHQTCQGPYSLRELRTDSNEDSRQVAMAIAVRFGDEIQEKLREIFWNIPGEPTGNYQEGLLRDLESYLRRHIWFREDRLYSLLSHWVMATWIFDRLPMTVRLIIFGTTRSGKSRVLEVLSIVSYRGFIELSPTPAALIRTIENWHPSVFIDEYQDLPQEARVGIDGLFKNNRKGASIARCEQDGEGVRRYYPYSPMAIGMKGAPPKEDMQNRAVVINMMEMPEGAKVERVIDLEGAKDLSGRLLAFRLAALRGEFGPIDDRRHGETMKVAEKRAGLDSRSIDLCGTLLMPSTLFRNNPEMKEASERVLDLMEQTQKGVYDEMTETIEGRVFSALQACLPIAVGKANGPPTEEPTDDQVLAAMNVSTTDIKQQLAQDDADREGDTPGADRFSPKGALGSKRVGNLLKSMGFELKAGTGNHRFFTQRDFAIAYRSNLKKYGKREI